MLLSSSFKCKLKILISERKRQSYQHEYKLHCFAYFGKDWPTTAFAMHRFFLTILSLSLFVFMLLHPVVQLSYYSFLTQNR